MVKAVRVKLKRKNVRMFMNSQEMQALMLDRAGLVKDRANAMSTSRSDQYTADVQPGKTRAHALVKTGEFPTRRDNAKNNTLLKALGGAAG